MVELGVGTELGSVMVQVGFGMQAGTRSSFVVGTGVRLGFRLRFSLGFSDVMAIFSFSI